MPGRVGHVPVRPREGETRGTGLIIRLQPVETSLKDPTTPQCTWPTDSWEPLGRTSDAPRTARSLYPGWSIPASTAAQGELPTIICDNHIAEETSRRVDQVESALLAVSRTTGIDRTQSLRGLGTGTDSSIVDRVKTLIWEYRQEGTIGDEKLQELVTDIGTWMRETEKTGAVNEWEELRNCLTAVQLIGSAVSTNQKVRCLQGGHAD
ncbi:uncharacterized protein MKK02DRAFT_33098 [Dioszegia hungarica]|uniref:Uncharacterized protein n=1 Tax=Dioszegia hungarica TaxID=4972 RepID=A0AA38LVH7_9TREE|nr:uncharacterized protein MKK02DRAFT_33098 [Dioszegia hungarica]KAI9635744.1 hypothetical protein MKK02DRAFT_33098 [Dioszegia hungarica]